LVWCKNTLDYTDKLYSLVEMDDEHITRSDSRFTKSLYGKIGIPGNNKESLENHILIISATRTILGSEKKAKLI